MLNALLVYDSNGRHIAVDCTNDAKGHMAVIPVSELSKAERINGVQLCRNGRVRVAADIPRVEVASLQYALYTGGALKRYIESRLWGNYKDRDVVTALLNYMHGTVGDRLFALSGLRGVGKTVALLQALQHTADYANSVYITLQKDMTFEKLMSIVNCLRHKKYIVIDELSEVDDIVSRAKYLADVVCGTTKVIVSGTDSLIFPLMQWQSLYHRVISYNITYKGYLEAKRVQGLSFDEYCKTGGIFEPDRFNTITDICNYTETAILNNITHTLQRNTISRWVELQKLSEVELRTLLFRLMYAIIYSTLGKGVLKPTSIARYINNYTGDIDYALLQDTVFSMLGLERDIVVTERAVFDLLEVLQKMGVIVGIGNFVDASDVNYYFINSAITMQISRALVKSLDSLPELSRKPNWTLKGVYGSVFESTVMCNIYTLAKQRGYNVYFYRKNNNAEVDIVLENEYGEMQRNFILLEVKSTSDMDTAIVKSKWLNIVSKWIPFSVDLMGAYIVYQGKTGIFNKFEAQDVFGIKSESVEEIAERNKGTLCINVEDLLTNFDKYIKFNDEG